MKAQARRRWPDHLHDLDRFADPSKFGLAHRAAGDKTRGLTDGLLGTQGLTGPGQALQPGGNVKDFTDRVVRKVEIRADGPDKGFSGRDTDVDAYSSLTC